MKSFRIPAVLLVALYLVFLGSLVLAAGELPERVATHFDISGRPDGWMTRSGDLFFMMAFGTALPLFIIAVFAAVRVLPAFLVNLPHRDYWLAPERRKTTAGIMLRFALWLACMMVGFFTVVHWLVVLANKSPNPRLNPAGIFGLLAVFLAVMGVWIYFFYKRFARVPD